MTAIAWCDPPTARPGRRPLWPELLAPVMKYPGEWALVRRWQHAHQAQEARKDLRRGRLRTLPGRWEYRTGRVGGTDEYGLWARYLGPELGEL
jgi:hypothetical protein